MLILVPMRLRNWDFFIAGKVLLVFTMMFYVIVRAFTVGATYDEVWTLRSFVPISYSDIYQYTICDANNHLLNTVLIKLIFSVFPDNLFLARLPNVIAAFFYCYFAVKLTSQYSKTGQLVLLIALLFNPFLLEFFSLARGYGLAMAFLCAALYYLQQYSKTAAFRSLFLATLMLFFLSISMFSSLHVVLPAFVLLLIVSSRYFNNQSSHSLYILLFMAFTTLVLYTPLKELKLNDSLYYGGRDDFLNDTFESLIRYSMGERVSTNASRIIATVVLFVFLLLFLFSLKHVQLLQPTTFQFEFLFFGAACSTICQFYILGTPLVVDRTALFFYPLLVVAGAELFLRLSRKNQYTIFKISMGVILLGNFFLSANLSRSSCWFFDAKSEEIVQTIKLVENGADASLQFSWPMRKSLEFYRDIHYPNLNLNYQAPLEAVKKKSYVALLTATIDRVDYQSGYDVLQLYDKDTVAVFKTEKIYLFKLR